ncbi:peritrophin-1-like [Sabethes cyaneus]|uniref:peritrophin-1-like n=1 Tax=Sabethes cyaneus TaxID=53552 RepID=UPI00237DD321|nr:peritrophin-1-like [Sabethes cyaneus]
MIRYFLLLALFGLAAASVSSICPSEGIRNVPLPLWSTRYVTCVDGIPTLSKCEPGTQFDANYGQCVMIASVQNESAEFVCPETDDPSEPMYVPHPGRCYVYFICVNGVAYEQICPDGTYFNPILRVCDLQENVDCPH